jgi:SAM-dependent methyltransferase
LNGDYHDSHDKDISRYHAVRRILDLNSVRRILDWGCGTGTFLSLLPPSVEKFGVETSHEAAEKARGKGIKTFLPSDKGLSELNGSFDAITGIDIVEHIADLNSLKVSFANLLRPGGRLVLVTGDLESPSAKATGRYWYYMHLAEHISFLSENSVRLWLESEFEDIKVARTSHHKVARKTAIYLALVFRAAWVLEKAGLAASLKKSAKRFVDCDHMLVTARRRGD